MKNILIALLIVLLSGCSILQRQLVVDSSMLTLEVRAVDSQLVSNFSNDSFLVHLTADEKSTVKAVREDYSALREQLEVYVKDPKELLVNINTIYDDYGKLYAHYLKIRNIVIAHEADYTKEQLNTLKDANKLILQANQRFLKVVEGARQEEVMLSYIHMASQVVKIAMLL